MSSPRDIFDDDNPVDETPPDLLALVELFKSQNPIQATMSSPRDMFDDDNPVDETPPDLLALVELFKSQNSNQSAFSEDDEDPFQYEDILDFVRDLLKGSTQMVDEVVQLGGEVPTEKKEEKGPPTFAGWIYLHFVSAKMDPLFRQIVCEMRTCKNGVEPDEKAQTILNMLRKYSWRGKAELTIAAFAVVFGDICVFAKFHHLVYEQVLKSSAIQKGEPFFANSSELLKRQVIIHQLKEIIETILQVMQKMEELPKPLQMDEIYNPIITTVVACAIEVSNLTNDKESDVSQNLSPYLKQIQEQQIILEKERDEFINHCEAIKKLQDSRTDIVEILKAMFFLNDNQPELIDASARHVPVKIDVLRGKNVFLFISSLDNVSEYKILQLKAVYEETKKDNNYTIVWIPIVEGWTDELRNKLDTILSFSHQMSWYVLPSFSLSENGIIFIKAHWYDKWPALVLLNPQGNLENPDVFRCILYGMEFFPFDKDTKDTLAEVFPEKITPCAAIPINTKKEKCIFFYGGVDDKWIQQFAEKATAVAEDAFLKGKYIKIKHFYVGETRKGKALHRIVGKSWIKVVAKLFSANHKQVDPVAQEIKKLSNLTQWAVLCKDSNVVISGDGSRFLTVLDEFDQWKEALNEKSFDITFKEYHEARTNPQ